MSDQLTGELLRNRRVHQFRTGEPVLAILIVGQEEHSLLHILSLPGSQILIHFRIRIGAAGYLLEGITPVFEVCVAPVPPLVENHCGSVAAHRHPKAVHQAVEAAAQSTGIEGAISVPNVADENSIESMD